MNANEWKKLYGSPYLVTPTDKERRYLALALLHDCQNSIELLMPERNPEYIHWER